MVDFYFSAEMLNCPLPCILRINVGSRSQLLASLVRHPAPLVRVFLLEQQLCQRSMWAASLVVEVEEEESESLPFVNAEVAVGHKAL